MTTYAVALLHDIRPGLWLPRYLSWIDATLAPFGGRFLVHGDPPEVLEGDWHGDLIVIAFPDRAAAKAWYASPAYGKILPLRRANATGPVILVDDVGPDHRATDVLIRLGLADPRPA